LRDVGKIVLNKTFTNVPRKTNEQDTTENGLVEARSGDDDKK